MVGIKTNHDKDYAENIPECFRQIDQLLNDTVKSHDSQLPNGAVKESTHVKDKQSSSGLDMNEFQLEIQRLRSDIDALHAYNRSLERDSAMIASVVPKNQKLRGKVDDLTKTLESKDAEIRMLRAVAANPTGAAAEASHTHVQMQSIKDTINDLITENRALMESIQDFKTQTGNATRIQASVSDMQTELATKEKINTQLTTKLAESADTIKHMIGLSESLRAERDTKDSQLEELQAKLDAAEEARDWYVCITTIPF
jgi:chromosome segregation ATPase